MLNRLRTDEIMDDPALDSRLHSDALRGLGRINRFSRSSNHLFQAITEISDENHHAPLKILDIASGGGDVVINLARMAKKYGYNWEISGSDISEHSVGFASQQAKAAGVDISFFQHDAVNKPIIGDYDVVMCTLFLHHLSEPDAQKLMQHMGSAASRLVLIDDLIRSRIGFILAWAGCRILSRSKVVHHDGPVSVKSAFTMAEALELSNASGLAGSTIKKHWPERFLLNWRTQ